MAKLKQISGLERVIKKFPGIKEKLEPYKGGYSDWNWKGQVRTAVYAETKNYQLAAVLWHEECYSDWSGGIEWKRKLELYYQEKDSARFKSKCLKELIVRDGHYPAKDHGDYWSMNSLEIKETGSDTITVDWQDKEKMKVVSYKCDLK